jgi:hypothetical protein
MAATYFSAARARASSLARAEVAARRAAAGWRGEAQWSQNCSMCRAPMRISC